MSSALPLSLDQDLTDRLNLLLHKSGHVGPDAVPRFERALLLRDFDRLSKTNVVQADCLRATLAMLEGDDELVRDRIRNLELNKEYEIARSERVRFAANRLHGTEFLRFAREAVEKPLPHPLHMVIPSMATLGAFRPARAAIEAANRQQRVAQATPSFQAAREGARVLDELGVTDEAMARAVDIVGEVFWKHRLIWLGPSAELWVSLPGKEPSLMLQYRVQLTPADAAELSWELAEALVHEDLPPTGISFGLLGTELHAVAVA